MKKFFKNLCILLILLAGVILIAKSVADARYFSDYDAALPLNVQEEASKKVDEQSDLFGVPRPRRFDEVKFSFDARPGDRVPTLLTFPIGHQGKLPVIIFLHGIGQSKGFLEDICTPFNEAGFAMTSFDQYSRGERKVDKVWWKQALAFRQRPWRTVNDVRRLIDYLSTRNDIDSNRIYLMGASYGAITGCTATALEKRIRAAVLVVGGGNLPVLLDAPVLKAGVNPTLYTLAKPIMCYAMRPSDPIRYADQVSPRPLLFLNGELDNMVTPAAGKALFAAARDPKEIRWYPCDHPGLVEGQGKYIVQMLDDALVWLKQQDAVATGKPAS